MLFNIVAVSHPGSMLLPPTHSKVELIEVVRITDPARHLTSQDLAGDDVALWEGGQAHQVLALIADLPSSELHRCFLPGWGIRAHSSTGLLFEIAFCFRCHAARIWGPGLAVEHQGDTFDPGSPAALQLLRRFRSCVTD
ncbi:hypothetical protein [Streptomyces sp. NPDC056817]|uniref:hypothetical protein n=1 Tax=Streptomyces sp. NPDC056817 TaxID=3345950 RepID=UPI0036AD1F5E